MAERQKIRNALAMSAISVPEQLATDALAELDDLEEQKEASDKAAAGMSADVTRFGQALQRIADAVEAWGNDETPDEDFQFEADMDFVNFCGHVARSTLASSPAKERE